MILFSEKQNFRKWWLWAVLLAVVCIFIYGIYKQLVLKQPFGDNPASDTVLLSSCLILLLVILLFLLAELETEINDTEVAYKFFPFVLRKVKVSWSNVEKAFIRKYSAVTEYGGWGYRIGLFGHGRALNISGDMGLQLILKSGKKLLIGTRRPDDVEKAIHKLREMRILNDKVL